MKLATDHRSILEPLLGNGRFLLLLTGLILFLTGVFVIAQSITGYFLPHDVSYIGLSANELSQFYEGRITRFMFHDRVAFGGSIMAVGVIYCWLAEFPLRHRQAWSWWIFVFSGTVGFGSFLTYLGFGYLDSWHGIATLLLFPIFLLGLFRSWQSLPKPAQLADLFQKTNAVDWKTAEGRGLALLQFVAGGLFAGGLVIMFLGMTTVFVPQDIAYMKIPMCSALDDINPNLISLIAHDRACFGGGLATIGLMLFFMLRRSEMRKSLWEILALSLGIGFSSAISVHFVIGYTDFTHLAPAYFGSLAALAGLGLTWRQWRKTCFPAK